MWVLSNNRMETKVSVSRIDNPVRLRPIAAALFGALGIAGNALAFTIESDNPDIKMSLDNVVRYNLGFRMKDRDPGLANNPGQDEGDYLYDKGDIITNRVDLFSEFDLNYKNQMGLRVTGQAWADAKYGDGPGVVPGATTASLNIKDGRYNAETDRYYHGPSAEFLDAFVWGQGKIGETNVVARLGRHSVLWGESMVGNTHAVSYSQQPSDGRKGQQSPGASAKETALPVNQFSGTWQFQPNASLSWQYQFEWKPNRLTLGGTYFAPDAYSDYISGTIPRVDAQDGEKGATGVMLKWTPEALGADLGFIYRKFSDTNPWAAQLNTSATPMDGRYVYARDIELWGLTFGKTINDIAIGAEISHRKNMALVGRSGAVNGGAATGFEGPVGDTWHALVNATAVFSKNSLWSSASLVGELQYSKLDKVTRNSGAYKSRSNPAAVAACAREILYGCATDDYWNMALIFTPTWLQVYPGLDFSLGNTLVVGLKGNAPTNGGGNEGSGQYKLNLIFDYQVKHKLEVGYTTYLGKAEYEGVATTKTTLGGGMFKDRDWLQLTYSYNF